MGFFGRLARWNAPFLSHWLRQLAKAVEALWPGGAKYGLVFFSDTKGTSMGEITVQDDHAPLTASVTFLDAKGAPTQPDDTPTWTSSDEDVATVEGSGDGLTATVTIGQPGATVIEVATVETNTGEEITAQGTITVQAGDTTIGEVTFAE